MTRTRVFRRGQRPDEDDGETRMARFIGDVCGLGESDVEFLPPSVQVGWMGAALYCLICSPQPPSSIHVPVFQESYFATQACVVCGRRLEESPV